MAMGSKCDVGAVLSATSTSSSFLRLSFNKDLQNNKTIQIQVVDQSSTPKQLLQKAEETILTDDEYHQEIIAANQERGQI